MRLPKKIFLSLVSLTFLLYSCGGTKSVTSSFSAENKEIQEKYAGILDVQSTSITNFALYRFIENWLGTPYKYGGKDRNGTDCSGFTSRLQKEIFGKEVIGPSWSIAENSVSIKEHELKEGDLVFFRIESKKISHVGVYLQNRRFVHASVSKGVIISSLDETYYKKYYHSSGRPK